jgi:hypothetical protein
MTSTPTTEQTMSGREDAWIVIAEWVNSSDTHHGPWPYVEDAERWARSSLDDDAAVTAWNLGILTPPADGAR